MARPVARWVLPVPGGPRNTTLSLRGDEVQGAQVGDDVAFEAAGVVEVELLQALAGGEPGGADAALAAVGLAGGDLALQAGGQELLVGPGLGPGPLGQPGHRLAQRGGLQRPGQERDLGGHVPGRCWSSRRPSRRSRRRRCPARCRSRPGRGCSHLRLGRAGRSTREPLAAQRRGRGVVLRVGDGLVPGPGPLVVGDQPARRRAPGPGPGPRRPRSGGRSPPGGPSSRWSPAGRSGRGPAGSRPATRSPAPPAAAPASRPGRRRSARPGRSPAPAACRVFASASQPASWALKSAGPVNVAAGQERASPGSRGPARPGPWPPGRRACRRSPWRPACRGTPGTRPVSSGLPGPPPADRALAVPHQHPRHRTQRR